MNHHGSAQLWEPAVSHARDAGNHLAQGSGSTSAELLQKR